MIIKIAPCTLYYSPLTHCAGNDGRRHRVMKYDLGRMEDDLGTMEDDLGTMEDDLGVMEDDLE